MYCRRIQSIFNHALFLCEILMRHVATSGSILKDKVSSYGFTHCQPLIEARAPSMWKLAGYHHDWQLNETFSMAEPLRGNEWAGGWLGHVFELLTLIINFNYNGSGRGRQRHINAKCALPVADEINCPLIHRNAFSAARLFNNRTNDSTRYDN